MAPVTADIQPITTRGASPRMKLTLKVAEETQKDRILGNSELQPTSSTLPLLNFQLFESVNALNV